MVVHSAYMLINKAIPSTGGPYMVRFYDDNGNLIQTDADVPQYGTAHCTLLDGTIVDGLYFKGWNPSPSNVTRNLDCYPVRGDYIINVNETHDSWETICADAGAHYPLGTYKNLVLDVYYDDYYNAYHVQDGVTGTYKKIRLSNDVLGNKRMYLQEANNQLPHSIIASVACDMVKVAEGEDGSTSTWISTGALQMFRPNIYVTVTDDIEQFVGGWANYHDSAGLINFGDIWCTDYSDCGMRYLLETLLMRSIPSVLQRNIKEVTKTYKGVSSSAVIDDKPAYDKTILAKIWGLSRKEMHTLIDTNYSIPISAGVHNYDEEFSGIDYSSIYMPTYTNYPRVYLRSMVAWNDTNLNRCTNHLGALRTDQMVLINDNDGNISTEGNIYIPFGFCL